MQKWTEAGINWGAIPSLKGKTEGTFIASDSLTMLKKCANPDLCYKLISFVTSGQQMEKLHKQAAFPPLGKDEKSNYPEQFAKMYAEKANILHPLPVIPNGAGTYQVLYANLQQMLNGQKTPSKPSATRPRRPTSCSRSKSFPSWCCFVFARAAPAFTSQR